MNDGHLQDYAGDYNVSLSRKFRLVFSLHFLNGIFLKSSLETAAVLFGEEP